MYGQGYGSPYGSPYGQPPPYGYGGAPGYGGGYGAPPPYGGGGYGAPGYGPGYGPPAPPPPPRRPGHDPSDILKFGAEVQVVTEALKQTSNDQRDNFVVYFPPMEGIPAGLEPLASLGQFRVKQEVEALEVILDIETNNRYTVFNQFNQRIFITGENSSGCARYCYGQNRPFVLNVFDSMGRVSLTYERKCNSSLCFWGGHMGGSDVSVMLQSTGEILGRIRQVCSMSTPVFDIVDASGTTIMKVKGPNCGAMCSCMMCGDMSFEIHEGGGNGRLVGMINKRFQLEELITDANTFGMAFQFEVSPVHKALVLGAVFAIDFSFFENGGILKKGETKPSGGGSGVTGCCCLCVWFFLIVFFTAVGIGIHFAWQYHKSKTNSLFGTTPKSSFE